MKRYTGLWAIRTGSTLSVMSVPYDLLALTPRTHIDLQNVSISCFQHLLGWLDFRGAALAVPGLLAYLMVSKGSAPELLEANAKAKTVCLHGRYRSRSDVLTGLYFLETDVDQFQKLKGNGFAKAETASCPEDLDLIALACCFECLQPAPGSPKFRRAAHCPLAATSMIDRNPELPGTCRLQGQLLKFSRGSWDLAPAQKKDEKVVKACNQDAVAAQ